MSAGVGAAPRVRGRLGPLFGSALIAFLVRCGPGAGTRVGDQSWSAVGGPGTTPGRFRQPRAIAIRPDGAFAVVDRSGRVQLFGPDAGLVAWFDLPAFEFGQPTGLTFEADGSLLVSDSHYQRLLRYRLDGIPEPGASSGGEMPALDGAARLVATVGGVRGTGPGEFTFGRDVVVDHEGSIYVGDYGGGVDRIQKFTRDGRCIMQWGRHGTGPGEFDHPAGMTLEPGDDGTRLLVADLNNHRVQRFTLDGGFVDAWGELGEEPGTLRFPRSVAVDSRGVIWVCEWGNNRVQAFDRAGRSLGVWGAPGREVGQLLTPWDVEVGPDDRLWVCDYGNHRVQVMRRPADLVPVPSSRARRVSSE